MFTVQAAASCDNNENCVTPGEWQLGLALGLGMRTNPLVDGSDIPLVLLPDIAWYGDNAYFDNGELGYQWQGERDLAFESFININRERGFFSFWHPANILIPTNNLGVSSIVGPDEVANPGTSKISIDDIATRHWAVDGGIRFHFHQGGGEWKLALSTDVSSVHNGQQVALSYVHQWQWLSWRLSLTPSFIWKSSNLIDYYYGVSARDKVEMQEHYYGQGGWQPSISLSASKKIDEHWQWLVFGSYQALNEGMSDSPLVESDNISSIFFGMAYRF
jgi:outer membrane protein